MVSAGTVWMCTAWNHIHVARDLKLQYFFRGCHLPCHHNNDSKKDTPSIPIF